MQAVLEAALGTGFAAGGFLGLARSARAATLSATDRDVLNYALSLEYLQAAFYTESERSKAITGKAGRAAQVAQYTLPSSSRWSSEQ